MFFLSCKGWLLICDCTGKTINTWHFFVVRLGRARLSGLGPQESWSPTGQINIPTEKSICGKLVAVERSLRARRRKLRLSVNYPRHGHHGAGHLIYTSSSDNGRTRRGSFSLFYTYGTKAQRGNVILQVYASKWQHHKWTETFLDSALFTPACCHGLHLTHPLGQWEQGLVVCAYPAPSAGRWQNESVAQSPWSECQGQASRCLHISSSLCVPKSVFQLEEKPKLNYRIIRTLILVPLQCLKWWINLIWMI